MPLLGSASRNGGTGTSLGSPKVILVIGAVSSLLDSAIVPNTNAMATIIASNHSNGGSSPPDDESGLSRPDEFTPSGE